MLSCCFQKYNLPEFPSMYQEIFFKVCNFKLVIILLKVYSKEFIRNVAKLFKYSIIVLYYQKIGNKYSTRVEWLNILWYIHVKHIIVIKSSFFQREKNHGTKLYTYFTMISLLVKTIQINI